MAVKTILPAFFIVALAVYGALPSDAEAQKTLSDVTRPAE